MVLAFAVIIASVLVLWFGWQGPIDWIMGTTRHGDRDRMSVALTFDDGPHPVHTPALLDALKELDVRATFFVVGVDVDAHPELVRRIVAEGHELGNHTYTHRYLPATRTKNVLRELSATDAAIRRATGSVPALARPPYGGRSPRTIRAFALAAKRLVLWDVNSLDWRGEAPPEIAQRVIARTRPGSIILMHEARAGGEATIAAVRQIVPELRARGLAVGSYSMLAMGSSRNVAMTGP